MGDYRQKLWTTGDKDTLKRIRAVAVEPDTRFRATVLEDWLDLRELDTLAELRTWAEEQTDHHDEQVQEVKTAVGLLALWMSDEREKYPNTVNFAQVWTS